ncbi:MAG TPA: glycosyltransferase [Stellaceae bacterium]|jgi:glycosyltransferase involved in cell wall biosynthesis|nr:glycosyltransferase [Stellaceae bacterium]
MPIGFRGLKKKPNHLHELLRRGDEANQRRSWSEAEDAYRVILSADPSLKHIWVQYGHALKEQGLLIPAEHAYRRSIDLDCRLADTFLQLGHVLKMQSRIDAAVDAYLTAHRLAPESVHPRIELQAVGIEVPGFDTSNGRRKYVDEFNNLYGKLPAPDFVSDENASDIKRAYVLQASNLASESAAVFDYRFYFYVNTLAQTDIPQLEWSLCLLHFCISGIDRLLLCNADFTFDSDFYCATYLTHQLGSANAYWHWLHVGFNRGWHPAKGNWLRSRLGGDAAALEALDLSVCSQFFHRDRPDVKWADLFERFITSDVLKPGPHLPVDAKTADFLALIADRFALDGKDGEASALYQRILLSLPTHKRALSHYADCLFRQRFFLPAAQSYMLLATTYGDSIWSILNRARCYEELGHLHEALTCLYQGVDLFLNDAPLKDRFHYIADAYLQQQWNTAIAIGRLGRYDDARACLHQACEQVSAMLAPKRSLDRTGPIRTVAIFGDAGLKQCYFYRVEQKIEQLLMMGYDAKFFDFRSDTTRFLEQIESFDAVIFFRVPAFVGVMRAIYKCRELGVVTFYDIDDLVFGGGGYPESFESFFNLISLDEYIGLHLGIPLFRHAISLTDYAIASTPALAAEMEKLVRKKQAFVHRNGFGKLHEVLAARAPHRQRSDRVRIFYGSATKSHKDDFRDLIEPALVEIVKRFGQRIQIVLVGHYVLSDEMKSIEKNLIILDPIFDIESYWTILQSCDINLAVFKRTGMTDCKSEIKWLEAAMFRIPSIVSGSATYQDVVEDGATGIICNNVKEWIGALDLLVRNGDRRLQIGQRAWEVVCRSYNMEAMGKNLASILAQAAPEHADVKKPVVVIVNVFYPPQAIGGATRVVHDNVLNISKNYSGNFEIKVFTTGWGPEERDYEIRSYAFDGVSITSVIRAHQSNLDHVVYDERMLQIFLEYLDRVNPAVIHFHCIQRLSVAIVSAAISRKIPYLITAHDGWWVSDNQFLINQNNDPELYDYNDPFATAGKWGTSSYHRMMRLWPALSAAKNVLSVSEKFADLYRACGVPNVKTVANGVSDIRVEARSVSADGRVRLAFIGGIGHIKGYDIIKYALLSEPFNNLRLLVIDSGLEPGDSKRTVWNTTPVDFVPKTPEPKVAALYANIDVLLAPSVWFESFGLVSREALLCGCWVVASDRGSIGDCVTDGENGFVIDVSNPNALRNVLRLIDNQPQRYVTSPKVKPALRRATEQADDLAAIYEMIIASDTSADGVEELRETI